MSALSMVHGDCGRWLDTIGRDVHRAFAECRRGDWLLRIAMAVGVDRRAIVAAAADSAALALHRTHTSDLRPSRAALVALRWTRGEAGPADAWAAAFGAVQAADDLEERGSLFACEAARAAAASAFACDPRADEAWYAQRGYPAAAIEHAVRAYGEETAVGAELCLQAARDRITLASLDAAAKRASQRPPALV